MYFVVVGLNHRTAPIELRERLTFTEGRLGDALQSLRSRPGLAESAILSTCNRSEIYGVVPHPDHVRVIPHFLEEYHDIPAAALAGHTYTHIGADAIRHLFRVSSGLDSLVLGEGQILRQVRDSFAMCSQSGNAGSRLNGLFRAAISTGKRARTETDIGKGGFSVGHAAVDLARLIFGALDGATILILGAGKMSELTAKHLVSNGVKFVMVANRTHERAAQLARQLGGSAIHYDEFPEAMSRADIVISSTASPHAVVTRPMLQPVMRKRRGRPLLLIDIAVPRDIDPGVEQLENVFLKNVDDLEEVVQDMARDRQSEVSKVEQIIAEETEKFVTWSLSLAAAPLVTQIRSRNETIRRSEIERLRNQIPDLDERTWQTIESAMKSLMNRIQKEPVERLKAAAAEDSEAIFDAARTLFGLDESRCPYRSEQAGESDAEANRETDSEAESLGMPEDPR